MTHCPAPVRRTLLPSSNPYTPYACGAQRALLPVAVGAMNVHYVRDRQTDRRRQTHHFIMPLGRGIITFVLTNVRPRKNRDIFRIRLIFILKGAKVGDTNHSLALI